MHDAQSLDSRYNWMFDRSILVVAHPDDEALWFSSILKQVDEVVFCFLNVASNPKCSVGRQKSISAHPLSNVSCLGLEESEVFDGADWRHPTPTQFGLAISRTKYSDKLYKRNYGQLKQQLGDKLANYRNVFTHNPWGEYGHEEHVQVYRVIKELQDNRGFDLWFSNYCSNKSFNLMQTHVSEFSSAYVTLSTDKPLANRLEDLYKKNECWTWYDDYEWFNEEFFIKGGKFQSGKLLYGHIFPLNFIRIDYPSEYIIAAEPRRTLLRRLVSRLVGPLRPSKREGR